ncbi:MAG: TetR/AcrR family transcriptional regulator [Deltaproteobacteria bacterium]|nr:TetR/AcrR family transcriptional regulator [Deltaproteobacteria bacterium]
MAGRQKSDEKRDEILAAAEGEFARREFHQVLMDDVAARAGVGKGTLYRYFPTKEELFLAMVLRGLDESHGEFLRAFDDETAAIETILESSVAHMLSYFRGREPLLALLQRYEDRLPHADTEFLRRRRDEALAAIASALGRAANTGRIRDVDTRIAAQMLLGMVRTAVLYPHPDMSPQRMAQEIVGLFLDGVRQPPSASRRDGLRAMRGAGA